MGAERCWITMRDGVRLATKLYLPEHQPAPVVLEALPYRMDDLTWSYRPEYERLRDEGGFAVARVDLRGTGSSGGVATDEYPEAEQADLHEVIAWLAAQSWSNGRVGMYGTSYSGFNSIQMAMERPPALEAIVAIYATDDRYTDDVHYSGGARRALDLVDYVLYMAAMNALPPVPAVAGPDWRAQWHERLAGLEPWLLRWTEEQTDGAYWRHGSLRPDYDRIECATMLVGGWADGYRNAVLRTFAALRGPRRVLLGPWSHMSPGNSVPGPRLDLVPELIAWFGHWLRDDDNGVERQPPIQVYMREFDPPAPDLDVVSGHWHAEPAWPAERAVVRTLVPAGEGIDEVLSHGDIGVDAWISCAGHQPWGQPGDQRGDDARSLTYEWPVDEPFEILGHPRLRLRVRPDAPVVFVSAKLSAVAADGTSALVARGFLNLTHRQSHTAPAPIPTGELVDVDIELDATAWRFEPGFRIRLSIAGSDWPNVWPPPGPVTFGVDRGHVEFDLPVLDGPPPAPEPVFTAAPARDGATTHDDPPTIWRIERDVLGRRTAAVVDHGTSYTAEFGSRVAEHYWGRVEVSTTDPTDATARAKARFEIAWDDISCAAEAALRMRSDGSRFYVEVDVLAEEDDKPVFEKTWTAEFARQLQ